MVPPLHSMPLLWKDKVAVSPKRKDELAAGAGSSRRNAGIGGEPTRPAKCSDQHWTWLLGIHRRTAGQRGDPAESLVGRNNHPNMPEFPQIKSDGQLQRIECSKAFRYSVLNQELPCAVKMAFVNGRSNNETLPCKIGPEAPSSDFQGLLIDLPSPRLDSEHRLQLHDRKMRDQRSRTLLLKYAVYVFGTALLVVAFRQRAGVKKIVWQSALCRRAITASEREPEIVDSARLTSSRLMSSWAASAHSSGVKYPARSWPTVVGSVMVTVTCCLSSSGTASRGWSTPSLYTA